MNLYERAYSNVLGLYKMARLTPDEHETLKQDLALIKELIDKELKLQEPKKEE